MEYYRQLQKIAKDLGIKSAGAGITKEVLMKQIVDAGGSLPVIGKVKAFEKAIERETKKAKADKPSPKKTVKTSPIKPSPKKVVKTSPTRATKEVKKSPTEATKEVKKSPTEATKEVKKSPTRATKEVKKSPTRATKVVKTRATKEVKTSPTRATNAKAIKISPTKVSKVSPTKATQVSKVSPTRLPVFTQVPEEVSLSPRVEDDYKELVRVKYPAIWRLGVSRDVNWQGIYGEIQLINTKQGHRSIIAAILKDNRSGLLEISPNAVKHFVEQYPALIDMLTTNKFYNDLLIMSGTGLGTVTKRDAFEFVPSIRDENTANHINDLMSSYTTAEIYTEFTEYVARDNIYSLGFAYLLLVREDITLKYRNGVIRFLVGSDISLPDLSILDIVISFNNMTVSDIFNVSADIITPLQLVNLLRIKDDDNIVDQIVKSGKYAFLKEFIEELSHVSDYDISSEQRSLALKYIKN